MVELHETFIGAIATATAPAATLMVIHQYKAEGPLVDTLLPVVAGDDAVGLVVFSISVSIAKIFVSGAKVSVLSTVAKWEGVTYKEDKEQVVNAIRKLIGDGEYPQDLWK